jgi:hypothetical protein
MPAQYTSETYSVETLLTEVKVMNILLTAIDGQPRHAFGTPCGHTKVGGGTDKNEAEKKDYLAALKASGLASYIRDPAVPAINSAVPKISGTAFVGNTGAEMIAWVKEVEKSEGVGVIVFHGVGGDYLSVSAEAHQQLLDYLAAHRAEIWTATYTEAMDYVVKHGH